MYITRYSAFTQISSTARVWRTAALNVWISPQTRATHHQQSLNVTVLPTASTSKHDNSVERHAQRPCNSCHMACVPCSRWLISRSLDRLRADLLPGPPAKRRHHAMKAARTNEPRARPTLADRTAEAHFMILHTHKHKPHIAESKHARDKRALCGPYGLVDLLWRRFVFAMGEEDD